MSPNSGSVSGGASAPQTQVLPQGQVLPAGQGSPQTQVVPQTTALPQGQGLPPAQNRNRMQWEGTPGFPAAARCRRGPGLSRRHVVDRAGC